MYDKVATSVRTIEGSTKEFHIRLVFIKALLLVLIHFTIVMDELTKEIQRRVPP